LRRASEQRVVAGKERREAKGQQLNGDRLYQRMVREDGVGGQAGCGCGRGWQRRSEGCAVMQRYVLYSPFHLSCVAARGTSKRVAVRCARVVKSILSSLKRRTSSPPPSGREKKALIELVMAVGRRSVRVAVEEREACGVWGACTTKWYTSARVLARNDKQRSAPGRGDDGA